MKCRVKGYGHCLPNSAINTGSQLSDQCNSYNLRILELCQGFHKHCLISYKDLVSVVHPTNPECSNDSVGAFTLQYNCTESHSLASHSKFYSLLDTCLRLGEREKEEIQDINMSVRAKPCGVKGCQDRAAVNVGECRTVCNY